MRELLWRTIVSAIGVWAATALVEGVTVTEVTDGWQQVLVYLVVGLVLAICQLIVKPLVRALTFPLYILTLGLFGIIVNALMLLLCSWVTSHFSWGIEVADFWPAAILGGLVISIVTTVVSIFVPRRRRSR